MSELSRAEASKVAASRTATVQQQKELQEQQERDAEYKKAAAQAKRLVRGNQSEYADKWHASIDEAANKGELKVRLEIGRGQCPISALHNVALEEAKALLEKEGYKVAMVRNVDGPRNSDGYPTGPESYYFGLDVSW